MKTAMQELHKHFIDAWSSPGDCWNPGKVIDKVESMIKKEKKQIIDAYEWGLIDGEKEAKREQKYDHSGSSFYDDFYNQKK